MPKGGTIARLGGLIAGLVLAGASVVWPLLALPAAVAVLLLVIVVRGARRWLAAVVGGLLVCTAGVRFVIEHVAPNVVIAGRRAAEDKAVSRLREIRWAQEVGRELFPGDPQPDGKGRYRLLEELVEPIPGNGPLLQGGFAPASGGIFKRDGYLFRVFLATQDAEGLWVADRSDPLIDRASRWVAFAWPESEGAGSRVFFIDDRERICEAAGGLLGAARQPSPSFGPGSGSSCSPAADGTRWQAWKGKKPLAVLP